MTTPAVNISSDLVGIGHHYTVYSDGSVWRADPSSVIWNRLLRQRPASVTHQKNPVSGWRDPGSWYHRGFICNPYPYGVIVDSRNAPTAITYYDGGLGWTSQGASPCPGVPDHLVQLAEARALSALKNQKVNLAVAFAERKETAEFVTDVVKSLASTAKALRRRNPKDWARALGWNKQNTESRLRKVPESYLSFMYAARPLVGDTYGACEALNSRERDASSSPYVVTVRGKAKATVRSSYYKGSNLSWRLGFIVDVVETHKVYVALNYVLKNPLAASLASVGITNPLEVLWERLPLSFVADWFVPVGNYLGQLDADMGYEFRSGTWSKKATRVESSYIKIYDGGGEAWQWTGQNWYYKGFDFARGLYSETPMPWTGLKNPFPKTGAHLAEAIALLAANLRS